MCGRFTRITDPEKITTILSDLEIDVEPSFKELFHKRRCIIFADGFYEMIRFNVSGRVENST
jgi:putative SOS response-associated peptidase YedK